MRKKLLALLLAAALALSLLAGCGGGESVASALLKLLDGRYPNISIEIDPELEADLRQAIRKAEAENAGDDAAVIRAALEKLVGSTVTFRKLGEGQQGDTTFDLVFYSGSDPDKAAQAAYSQWNIVFDNVPADGQYDTSLAMVETNSGVWMLVKATVEKAGTVDKPDSEPVTLQGIAIAQQPDQIKYKDGEAFDPSGMKITATYSDGSKKTIDGTSADVTFSPETITDGTTSVTVFYGGKQTAVSVECITLNQITVKLTRTEYAVNEELTFQNISVQAVYSDNATTEPIEPGKCSFTLNNTPINLPHEFLKGGNYSLTVTYDGKTSNPVKIHVTDQNGYHEDNGSYVVTGTDGLQKLYNDLTKTSSFANATITLNSPVTLDDAWPENITFTGELNGNGNKITMEGDRTQGLFDEINGGTVENVHLQIDGTIKDGTGYIGGIAGTLKSGGTVKGCSVTGGSISGTGDSSRVGGVVGYSYGGTVTACYHAGTVQGGSKNGGVVGQNYGTVTACYHAGTVQGSGGIAGGVVGIDGGGTVTACYWSGTAVSANGSHSNHGIGIDITGESTNDNANQVTDNGGTNPDSSPVNWNTALAGLNQRSGGYTFGGEDMNNPTLTKTNP